jgi:hypothetical protein
MNFCGKINNNIILRRYIISIKPPLETTEYALHCLYFRNIVLCETPESRSEKKDLLQNLHINMLSLFFYSLSCNTVQIVSATLSFTLLKEYSM